MEPESMFLHPNSRFVSPKGESFDANPNDGSVVLKVVYGKCAVLFMGDVDQPAEWAITEIYGDFLKSDILKGCPSWKHNQQHAAVCAEVQADVCSNLRREV